MTNKNKKNAKKTEKGSLAPLETTGEVKKITTKKVEDMTQEDALQIIKHIREITDEINDNIDQMMEKSGWSGKYSKADLDNPSNYTPAQWKTLQEKREKFMQAFKAPSAFGGKKGKKTPFSSTEPSSATKQRKSKSVASRRKWLPMR